MSSYTLSAVLPAPYETVLDRVRVGLVEVGFGIITEIDMAATLKAKIDADIPPQVILGACRPTLAYAALKADPSIAAVLPCNVVVRATEDGTTVVESIDPAFLAGLAGGEAVRKIATDARERICSLLDRLTEEA